MTSDFGVGAVGSERAATAATTTTHWVTIPAGAFIPVDGGTDYWNRGFALNGTGWFTAPVPFHRPGAKVSVRNMTIFVMDNHPGAICATLFATTPADGYEVPIVQTCSDGMSPGVRSFNEMAPPPRNITQYQGPYVWLHFGDRDADLTFYGVRIAYRVTE